MLKPLIAGITALSLTLAAAAPAHANGLDRENVGKLLLGLATVAAIGIAIENNREDDRRTTTVTPAQRVNDRTYNWADLNRPRQRGHDRRADLPRDCLRDVETRFGTQRLLGRRCLQRNYAQFDRLPNRCAVRVFSDNGPRNGFDARCLREQGYRINRRR